MEIIILKIIVLALSIYLVGKITRLFQVEDFLTAIITAILLALVNAFLKPLLILLTLPLTLITLGLFLFIINGLCLQIVSAIFPKFRISGCLTAALAALLISLINLLLESIII
ncbi:MAG: phage holin family protein [Candidatus Cloacimonetes bacterium]|nr:phage holin family protein [Candidatus Cloacimonadota bacterium]